MVLRPQVPRHVGQQHDADGDADDGERQLVDAIGVVEVGHRPVLQRRDDRADDDVELGDAAGDDAGDAETDEPAHAFGHARPAQLEPDVVAPQSVDEQPELQDAGREHAPGLDDAGHRIVLQSQHHGDDGRRHHGDVQDDGDRRALDELAERVQDARHHRDERHAQQVGHGDARQQHGEVELVGRRTEARRQAVHQQRHGDLGDDRQRQAG